MLQLPPTIRAPRPEEMPERQDIEQLLAKRKTAKIAEGFRLELNKTPQLPFVFFAEINIDNPRLWSLFLALAATFPESVNVQYSLYEEELFISDLFPKEQVVEELATLQQELTQDGTLVFGLLTHTKQALVELQVTESKYIKFWGIDQPGFLSCMASFQLKEITGLEFIDEYPKVVEPLKRFIPSSRPPEDVIWKLDRTFRPS
ncbi:MAG: hypothetical protein H7Y03_08600 [Chitinophagaceae bacterium]|nr:hypothetical protein [Chitinophagaceae bacterium]